MKLRELRPTRPDLPGLALLCAVYTVTAVLGLSLRPVGGFASYVWPPTGIALAALRLRGPRLSAGVLVGAFVANLITGATVPTALGVGIGNALEAIVGAWLLVRAAGPIGATSPLRHALALLILAAPVSAVVSATVGVSTLVVSGLAARAIAWEMSLAWWLGDVLGAIVVYPLLVFWLRTETDLGWSAGRRLEAAALAAATIGKGLLDFARVAHAGESVPAFRRPYGLFPIVVWAAVRFGGRGVSAATFVIAVIAIPCTLLGRGFFAQEAPAEALLQLQVFMGFLAGTGLILAAAIEEQERAERALRSTRETLEVAVDQRTRELRSSLAEKELLLRELHHRVKNNLQIIMSLLHLQRDRTRDPRVRDAFQDSEGRVRAIALVHEIIHQTRDVAAVDLRRYVESICRAMLRANASAASIALDVDVPDLRVGLDAVVPCGLLLNEALTNAFKHAFVGRSAGRITVAMRVAEDQVLLEIADDGIGLPKEIDLSSVTSLGLQLISGFVKQLDGTIEVDRRAGTCFRIRFPSARLGLQ